MQFMNIVMKYFPVILGVFLTLILFALGLPLLTSVLFLIGIALGVEFLFVDLHFLSDWYQIDYSFSRSFLFLVVFAPCMIFMMTSSGSLLGNGLVLGVGLSRLADFLRVLSAQPGTKIEGVVFNGQDVPKEILRGGADPFSLNELQGITIGLGLLILLFLVRTIFYV